MKKDKVVIAIIDTGIDFMDNTLINSLSKDYYCLDNKYRITDCIGHGSMVAKTILRENINAKILPINIFNNKSEINSFGLVEALDILTLVEVNIINLSISSFRSIYEREIEDICMRLSEQGKIIVASSDRYGERAIPAIFDCVIGVGIDKNIKYSEFLYNKDSSIQCTASADGIIVKTRKGYDNFKGTSKAASYITGKISNIIEKSPFNVSKQYLENRLEIESKLSLKRLYTMNKKKKKVLDRVIKEEPYKIYNLINLIKEIYSIEDVSTNYFLNNPLFSNITGIGKHNCGQIIEAINKNNDKLIDLDIKQLYLSDFDSINSLYYFLYERGKLDV